MKKGLTELVFILDKSGSMSGLESDTIGGFNAMLEKQKNGTGSCQITTVLFDINYELLHDRLDIRAVDSLTDKDYCIGGSTALLDAIGRTVNKIANVQKRTAEDFKAEKVIIVIITDGQENASREFTEEKIRSIIEQQKTDHGWEFIFLGANIDAVKTANRFGITEDRAQDFHADTAGIELNFRVMSEAVTFFRDKSALAEDWNKEIQKDYKTRKSNH